MERGPNVEQSIAAFRRRLERLIDRARAGSTGTRINVAGRTNRAKVVNVASPGSRQAASQRQSVRIRQEHAPSREADESTKRQG
jgi:hypothetical protein